MAEITDRLNAIETKLNEASTEILALIDSLRGEHLSPEGLVTLASLETKATALADIVPNPVP